MIASTRVTTYEIPIYDFRQIFAAKTVNNKKHEEIMVLRKENDARHKVGQLTYHFHTGIQSPPHGYTMDYQAFERRKREQVAQDPAAENLPSPHAPANATMDHKVTTASVLSVSSGSTTAEYPEAV